MSYNEIFIIKLVIRTVAKTVCQKFRHLVLIQIHFTTIAFIVIIIYIIDTGVTVRLLYRF